MAKKKRHHYLPQFYLRGFADPHNEPYIWVYEKGNPETIRATADNIAIRKHYYSFMDESGQRDSETLENALAQVEASAAPVIEMILRAKPLGGKERSVFAFFLAITMLRVPCIRQNMEDMAAKVIRKMSQVWVAGESGLQELTEICSNNPELAGDMTGEELQKFMLSKHYEIEINPEFSLPTGEVAGQIAPILHSMNWAYFSSTDDYKFVTSDNPVFFTTPTPGSEPFHSTGLLHKNVQVTFPISRDLALVASWRNFKGYKRPKGSDVRQINRRTILAASRFVFGPQRSEKLNTIVQECKDSAPRMELH